MKTLRRRKREGKTDYRQRIGLLKSGLPRVVVRKTNSYIVIQYVKSQEAKDSVVYGTTSKELLKYGWPGDSTGSLKSLPAAYLTGYLAGKMILSKEKKAKAVLDIGLHKNISGGRIYSALKGLVDAGIDIVYDKKIFPDEERITGKHLNEKLHEIFSKVKQNIEK